MFLKNYHHLKKKEIYILIFLFLSSVLIRIPTIFILGDASLENEWKDIVNSLSEHGQFLYKGLPNIFMPPLYAFYLYFFSIFNLEEQNYIQLILLSQVLLSSISVAVFYKLNKIFFSQKISFYSSLLFSLFPLHIYACSQISSITLQVFLTILFFYFFFEIPKRRNLLSIFLLSLVSGLLILLRGEFIVIFVLSFLYLLIVFKIQIKKILLMVLITLIIISPYLIRNILVFNSVTITKSFGYNLWKGNNSNSAVEGSVFLNDSLQKQITNIPNDKYYPLNLDRVYLDEAIKNIKEEPKRYLTLFVKKAASFLFIDIKSSQPNYYNPLHYLPVLLLGITSLIGIVLSDKKSYQLNYLILIFFVNVIIFSSFFILPRYKLAILPIQIIFTNIFIEYIYKKFFRRYE
jgi:4-amino-4-deoxy-L-arabinose transferase-like glycosyltransferase